MESKPETFRKTKGYSQCMRIIMGSDRFREWTRSMIIREAIRELARRVMRRAR